MMLQLLVGILLGAMVSTETGRSIGNQLSDAAIGGLKKVTGAVTPTNETREEDAHEADSETV